MTKDKKLEQLTKLLREACEMLGERAWTGGSVELGQWWKAQHMADARRADAAARKRP